MRTKTPDSSTHYARYSVNPILIAEAGANLYKAMRAEFPDEKLLVAYRGYSGASLGGAILACAGQAGDEKIRGAFVRKTLEGTHSYTMVEHDEGFEPTQLVVIDDFICSGKTIREIEREVNAAMSNTFRNLRKNALPTVVMVVYYASFSYRNNTMRRIYSAEMDDHSPENRGWRDPELRAPEVEPIPEELEPEEVSYMVSDEVVKVVTEAFLPKPVYGPGAGKGSREVKMTFIGTDGKEREPTESDKLFTDELSFRMNRS